MGGAVRALIGRMRAWCVIAIGVAACGGATPSVTAAKREPVVIDARPDAMPDAAITNDAMPDASPDASDDTVGAIAVPSDDGSDDPWKLATIDEVDTSVAIDDVKNVKGPWPKTTRTKMRGRVMLALHADDDGMLRLSIIETSSDDQGAREDLELERVKPEMFGHAFDVNAYLSRQGRDEIGPILFAARVVPPDGGERRQIVVFSAGAEVRVVEKALSASAWKPMRRVTFRRGATFVGIETSDPH
jgi:hypothetical protein